MIDGVQAELNPGSTMCRQSMAVYIASSLQAIKTRLESSPDFKGIQTAFDGVVDVDEEELMSLDPASRILGCAPSLNYYDEGASIGVDPASYRTRSAGGHIHMGISTGDVVRQNGGLKHLVPILDIIVGNTSVMIDRDSRAAERRQVYGRAGEYRLPSHGLEYRTLSNFWLKDYSLMSFIFVSCRLAKAILFTSHLPRGTAEVGWDAESELYKRVSLESVREAINTNNIELAKANFDGVKSFVHDFVKGEYYCGLTASCLPEVEVFLRKIEENGLDFWFPGDIMENWVNQRFERGWENFMSNVIYSVMAKDREKKAA